MTHFEFGPRAGRTAPLRLGACAIIFDDTGRVLLTQRADNGQWCLPGGIVEPGERVAEAVTREVAEETGLEVEVERLVGVYSEVDRVSVYPDGNRASYVVLAFVCRTVGGTLTTSDETLAYGYYDPAATPPLTDGHPQRLRDALERRCEAFVR